MTHFPLEAILTQLTDDKPDVRQRAVELCGRAERLPADEALRDRLIALLQDERVDTRRWVVMALSHLRDDVSVRAIGEALRDDAPPVRRRVCAFLIKYPTHPALYAPLSAILLDEDVDLSARDFCAMTLAHHPQARPQLLEALMSAPSALYRRLVHSLMYLPHPDNVPVLAGVLGRADVDGITRKLIERAIAQIEAS